MLRVFCLITLLCLGWGCKTAPVYQPFDGTHGFSHAPIEPDVYEVSYIGTPTMSVTDARFYATVRAAELAVERGRSHIELIESSGAVYPRSIAMPGSTTVQTRTSRDRRGRELQTTTVRSTPGYVRYYEIPQVQLMVRLLDEATENSLEALSLLRDGRRREARYGPGIEAMLEEGPHPGPLSGGEGER